MRYSRPDGKLGQPKNATFGKDSHKSASDSPTLPGVTALARSRLFERGAARLEGYGSGEGPTYGLDLPAVVNCARDRMRTGP